MRLREHAGVEHAQYQKSWPERVLKSMLGKCSHVGMRKKSVLLEPLGVGEVMELRLVTSYFPSLLARLNLTTIISPVSPHHHPILIPAIAPH